MKTNVDLFPSFAPNKKLDIVRGTFSFSLWWTSRE